MAVEIDGDGMEVVHVPGPVMAEPLFDPLKALPPRDREIARRWIKEVGETRFRAITSKINWEDQPGSAPPCRNGAANAIRAVTSTISDNQNVGLNFIEHEYVPGVLTAQAFTVRVGAQNGLLYLNGASVRYFGGTAAATIVVEEIPA
jgi:hypothetical protein